MAKKDPYKNIQKRFVQARAGDVEYEDLSIEQREQFQNRFNTLAQTVEGRTKIAQRLLPTATPEQRAQLKQRIRKNLPNRGQEIEMPGEETVSSTPMSGTTTTSYKKTPKQSTSEDVRFQNIGSRSTNAQRASFRRSENVTSKVTSDRVGSGFFSVPKSPTAAIKEFATGAKDLVTDTADIVNRGYINPVINIVARGADVVGGTPKNQRFKPLPQLSNKEIAIESALTLGTAGVGQLLRPIVRPSGAALGSLAKALGGRVPGVGAALGNISQRQANLAAVREASALADAGARAVAEQMSAFGTNIGTGTIPKPSGAKFSTPKRGSSVTRPTTPKPVTQKAVTSKTGRGLTKQEVKLAKQENIKSMSELQMVAQDKLDTGPKTKTTKPKSAKTPKVPKAPKAAKTPKKEIEIPAEVDNAMEALEIPDLPIVNVYPTPKKINKPDDILEILNKPPTKKEIETATENYAPGFNEAFGDIEMPGTDRAYDDYMSSIDESLANMMPKTKPVPKSKRPKLVDKEAKTEEWVRKGGKAKPIKVEEIKPTEAPKSSKNYFGNGRKQLSRYVNQEPVAPKTATPNEVTPKTVAPKAPKKPKGQKKNQVASPAPQTVDEPFDALDLQLAKDYPYSSTARRVYAAQRSKPIVQPTGQMAIEPRVSTTQPKIEESLSDKLLAAFKAEPKKKTGPDFTPRKVIKLPKVEPYSGQKVTGDQADSILFRAFDKGKRPKRSGGDYAISQPMDVDIGTSPRLFPETNIPAGTQKDLQKEIQETIGIPEANIRQGRAINLRSRRKTKGKPGDMEMPTAKSLAAEGEPRTVPTEIPSTETGLSSEQRRTRFYREMFPQARSARQARKMYEESMGRQDILTTIEEFGPIGNPQGPGAPRLPITTTEVQRPVKFEKTLNKRGEVVYKPVKFETETVPAIWTTSSETKPTPLEDVVEMLYPRVDAAKAEAGRQTRKAAKLKSQAEQAARLRNRGVVGDEARKKADEVVRAQKEGKEFQKGNEIELARELSAFYENYMKEGFEQKRFRPALPEKPKTPKKKRNKKK